MPCCPAYQGMFFVRLGAPIAWRQLPSPRWPKSCGSGRGGVDTDTPVKAGAGYDVLRMRRSPGGLFVDRKVHATKQDMGTALCSHDATTHRLSDQRNSGTDRVILSKRIRELRRERGCTQGERPFLYLAVHPSRSSFTSVYLPPVLLATVGA